MAMSRRHAKPRLSPIWMPYLRDKLADWLDDRHDVEYGRPSSAYSDMLQAAWSQGDSLRHSPMWFVSRDMTTLAVHTALHEEPPMVEPPSSTGFIMFDGGVDFECAPGALPVHIVAVRWVIQLDENGDRHVGVALFTDNKNVRESLRCPLPLAPVPHTSLGEVSEGAMGTIGNILQATWALSAEPTVCEVSRPQRPPASEPLPHRVVERAVSNVRMVVLRERHDPTPTNGGARDSRRGYGHRFIVRGFWRNQAYGPEHGLRRRQWIPPFVKGPADKPLVTKETVRIWRR